MDAVECMVVIQISPDPAGNDLWTPEQLAKRLVNMLAGDRRNQRLYSTQVPPILDLSSRSSPAPRSSVFLCAALIMLHILDFEFSVTAVTFHDLRRYSYQQSKWT